MENNGDTQMRCALLVAALCRELAWTLDATQQQRYVAGITPHIPEACSDASLRAIVERYHQDHQTVQALLDRHHRLHDDTWDSWCAQAVRIVRHGLSDTSHDVLADVQDQAQAAMEGLMKGVRTFHYASRFSTWAYAVIAQSAQRYRRDLGAAKRAGNREPLDMHTDTLVDNTIIAPEASAEANALAELVREVLTASGDKRLAHIFLLWGSHNQRLGEIGRAANLSPSRVSALIAQARQQLQQHPKIQSWVADSDQALAQAVKAVQDAERPDRYV